MAEAKVTVLGRTITLPCAPGEEPRFADLAAALERRLASGEGEPEVRLAQAALLALAEAQRAGAALARAHSEIDQLNDLLIERASPREAWRRAERRRGAA